MPERQPLTEIHGRLLTALKELGGTGTVGDLVQRAQLAESAVREHILAALSHVGGHVAVDAHGQLRYAVDRTRDVPRFAPAWPIRLLQVLAAAFRVAFFAALSLMLVVYFVIYLVLIVVLLVLGLVAAAQGGDCDCNGCDCNGCDGCGGCGGCGGGGGCDACCPDSASCNKAGDTLHAKTAGRRAPDKVKARVALRDVQRERRAVRVAAADKRARARRARLRDALASIRQRGRASDVDGLDFPLEDEVITVNPPFFRAVRDFVFGPLRPAVSEAAERENLVGFLRDHGGRVTATDAALVTGLTRADADRLLLELAVTLGGDVEVTEAGVILYVFDDFIVSAGADLNELDWLTSCPGGHVTVQAFATARGLSTAHALSRLEQLREVSGATLEAGGERTVFIFDAAARRRLAEVGVAYKAMRDYHFCWERLEHSPAVIGVPVGKRGWIWGFNTLNLCVSAGLLAWYADGARLVGEAIPAVSFELELLLLGAVPAGLSLAVFGIPLIRAIVELARDFSRRRRNTRRLLLLALAERLMTGPSVTSEDLTADLGLGETARGAVETWLARLGAEFDATLDPTDAGALDFSLAHREVTAVELHAASFRDARRGLQPIVYDTARPDDLPDA